MISDDDGADDLEIDDCNKFSCQSVNCQRPYAQLEMLRILLKEQGGPSYPEKLQVCDNRTLDCECAENVCCANCGQQICKSEKDEQTHSKLHGNYRSLLTWEYWLKQRQKVAKRIMKHTGKMPCEILFNRRNLDDRDKMVIQTMLEKIDSLDTRAPNLEQLMQYYDPNIFRSTENFQSPAPSQCYRSDHLPKCFDKAEKRAFEISGVPALVRKEMYGADCNCAPLRRWFDSKLLQNSIRERKHTVKKIMEVFPDIENLLVIGTAMKLHPSEEAEEEPVDVCNCGLNEEHPKPYKPILKNLKESTCMHQQRLTCNIKKELAERLPRQRSSLIFQNKLEANDVDNRESFKSVSISEEKSEQTSERMPEQTPEETPEQKEQPQNPDN